MCQIVVEGSGRGLQGSSAQAVSACWVEVVCGCVSATPPHTIPQRQGRGLDRGEAAGGPGRGLGARVVLGGAKVEGGVGEESSTSRGEGVHGAAEKKVNI